MKAELIHKTEILGVFAPAIANGDATALEADEIIELEEWLEQFTSECDNVVYKFGEANEFAECDIIGLYGDCVEVSVYYLREEV